MKDLKRLESMLAISLHYETQALQHELQVEILERTCEKLAELEKTQGALPDVRLKVAVIMDSLKETIRFLNAELNYMNPILREKL